MMGADIVTFSADARSLDVDAFVTKHGVGFFVRDSLSRVLNLEQDGPEGRSKITTHEVVRIKGPALVGTQFYAYRLRKRRGKTGDVTIGRLASNDVCLPDSTVSKRHAKLRYSEETGFSILDGDVDSQGDDSDSSSRNGTAVGGALLSADAWLVLQPGISVQIGQVKMTYLPAADFIEFVKRSVDTSPSGLPPVSRVPSFNS